MWHNESAVGNSIIINLYARFKRQLQWGIFKKFSK